MRIIITIIIMIIISIIIISCLGGPLSFTYVIIIDHLSLS